MNYKKIHSQQIKSFDPTVDYIEKISDIDVDIKTMLDEFNFLNDKNWDNNFVQSKLCVYKKDLWLDFTESMVYTKSIIDSLKKYMPYNSVYYRYVKPNTCYNWHVDIMKTCLHIPLKTNNACKFVYDDKVFSMPADGSVYIVNNSKPHTFVNAGNTDRLHITMDIF